MIKPKTPTFLLDYPFEGSNWSIDLPAESWDEAQRRLQAIANYGKIQGELMGRVPVGMGWFAKALCWFKNWASD